MAAPFSFSRWFGTFFLWHKPAAQGRLAFSHVRENRLDIKAVLRGKLLTRPMDFLDDRIFPHDAILP